MTIRLASTAKAVSTEVDIGIAECAEKACFVFARLTVEAPSVRNLLRLASFRVVLSKFVQTRMVFLVLRHMPALLPG